jgi:hypothetical protein
MADRTEQITFKLRAKDETGEAYDSANKRQGRTGARRLGDFASPT